MSNIQSNPAYAGDVLDLRELFSLLMAGKLLIMASVTLAGILALAVTLVMPNVYRSTTILVPKPDSGTGGLSRLAAQYGGLASLAGINLGGLDSDGLPKSTIALKKMQSFSFFEQHLYDELLVDLMAVESWEAEVKILEYDEEIYDVESGEWVRDVDFPYSVKPSAQEAHEEFLELLTVSEDKQSGLISVSMEHQSPDIAKRWLEMMVLRVSEDLRAKDIAEAEDSIAFLERQREKTSLVSLDEVFAQLIEEQTKKIMLANVSRDYLFDIIDPPVAPEMKAKPNRTLICALSALIGGILGTLFVLMRRFGKAHHSGV